MRSAPAALPVVTARVRCGAVVAADDDQLEAAAAVDGGATERRGARALLPCSPPDR